MRWLGIDFGERRIGLAISDPEGRMAVPLTTLERRDDRGAARAIARLAASEGVGGLVLGEPLGLDGAAGEAAQRVRRFGRRLADTTALPVHLVTETLTSVEAERRLREAGVDPRRHPERIDSTAAQILLQEALDGRLGAATATPRSETP
ncbi:MAG: Holliday junction resolvase RuvX [Acidobacteria bacterium]|nr:Holliday junction resolvase RuvX [Acidobacteriota bacterium]